MKSALSILSFLLKAIIVGLAAAFLIVMWKLPLGELLHPAPAEPAGGPPAPASAPPAHAQAPPAVPGTASYADAVARSAPAVVNIYTARVVTERTQPAPLEQLFGDYWPSFRRRVERSLGSGVIVDKAGHIITNHHVIAGADSIRVQLSDQRVADAKVIGTDPDTDIAVLQLTLSNLPVMPLGRSDALRVGDVVLAIGNPYGLSQTVTQGIVSATGRGQLGLATFENFIQTDAAINLGNSGGALIDAKGELVGINTAVLNRNYGGPEGIGFAIPVNLVRGVMDQIVRQGRVVRGWLGLEPQDLTEEQASQLGLVDGAGVVVANIMVQSPAFEAGVRPGDVIEKLAGVPVHSAQEVTSKVAALKPGAPVDLALRRGGQRFSVKIKALERPLRDSRTEGQQN
ncbi:MAG: trypsin-like peptidase domain-containing protein [Steroidobacteraceae bacterium]